MSAHYWRAVVRRDYLDKIRDPDDALDEAIPALERLGDDAGLADAWLSLHLQFFWRGQVRQALAAANRALHHARRAGVRSSEIGALYYLAGDGFLDDTALEEVVTRADLVIELTARHGLQAARALGTKGRSFAMMGRIDEGRSLVVEVDTGRARVRLSLLGGWYAVVAGHGGVLGRSLPSRRERSARRH